MGNSQSYGQDPTLHSKKMEEEQQYVVFQSQDGNGQYQKYIISDDGSINFLNQYEFRIKNQHPQLVNLVYAGHLKTALNCTQITKYQIVTQRIPYRLKDLMSIDINNALIILRSSLKGFKDIYKKHGCIKINDCMIGVNKYDKVKVWLNQNFALNFPQQSIQKSALSHANQLDKGNSNISNERQMINNIFDIINLKTKQDTLWSTLIYKKQYQNPQIFDDFLRLIDNHIHQNRIFVGDKVNNIFNKQNYKIKRKDIINKDVNVNQQFNNIQLQKNINNNYSHQNLHNRSIIRQENHQNFIVKRIQTQSYDANYQKEQKSLHRPILLSYNNRDPGHQSQHIQINNNNIQQSQRNLINKQPFMRVNRYQEINNNKIQEVNQDIHFNQHVQGGLQSIRHHSIQHKITNSVQNIENIPKNIIINPQVQFNHTTIRQQPHSHSLQSHNSKSIIKTIPNLQNNKPNNIVNQSFKINFTKKTDNNMTSLPNNILFSHRQPHIIDIRTSNTNNVNTFHNNSPQKVSIISNDSINVNRSHITIIQNQQKQLNNLDSTINNQNIIHINSVNDQNGTLTTQKDNKNIQLSHIQSKQYSVNVDQSVIEKSQRNVDQREHRQIQQQKQQKPIIVQQQEQFNQKNINLQIQDQANNRLQSLKSKINSELINSKQIKKASISLQQSQNKRINKSIINDRNKNNRQFGDNMKNNKLIDVNSNNSKKLSYKQMRKLLFQQLQI